MLLNDDEVCEICFSGSSSDGAEALIFCDRCNSCFHLRCAGLSEDVLKQDNFFCTSCLRGR